MNPDESSKHMYVIVGVSRVEEQKPHGIVWRVRKDIRREDIPCEIVEAVLLEGVPGTDRDVVVELIVQALQEIVWVIDPICAMLRPSKGARGIPA
jgi:predicted hydrolase (HD superfamily)